MTNIRKKVMDGYMAFCLDAGYWLLVAGCWLLVAGCWLLVACCWLLVAGWLVRLAPLLVLQELVD
jgi:hypothetical protein